MVVRAGVSSCDTDSCPFFLTERLSAHIRAQKTHRILPGVMLPKPEKDHKLQRACDG